MLMERNDQIHLPPKKRRFGSVSFEPEKSSNEFCFHQQGKVGKTEENPINGDGFLYPPNKRFSPRGLESESKSKLLAQKASAVAAADLNALFEYIRSTFLTQLESEEEWDQPTVLNEPKEEKKTRKKKGHWWKSGWRWGLKKWRGEKMGMGLKKEKLKESFGKFWTGNESFKWKIEHYSDPLSFPPRTWQ